MTAKQTCKMAAFILIGALLFAYAQEVFMPKLSSASSCEKKVSGLYVLEDNTVDVLVLGTSLVDHGYSPMKVYADTGIRSYNYGTSAQCIQSSYYLLKNAMETQNPKLVILEPSVFFQKQVNPSFYRVVMDTLYPSKVGLEMALDYKEYFGKTWAESLLPIVSYHTRWNELAERDFLLKEPQADYTMGLGVAVRTVDSNENMKAVMDSQMESFLSDPEANAPSVSPWAYTYLDKIIALCQEKGSELMFIKLPGSRSPYDNGWSTLKSEATAQLADSRNIPFVDMTSLGLTDFQTDTYDGRHMNIRGTEKASGWIGGYLAENYPELDRTPSSDFENALEAYEAVRDVAVLQSEVNFESYLEALLENRENWSFAVAGFGDFVSGLSEQDKQLLAQLGLDRIGEATATNTFAAVVRKGEVEGQFLSDRYLAETVSGKNWRVNLTSATTYDSIAEGRTTSVAFNGTKVSSENGLLFLVWDNERGVAVDAKSFCTGAEEKTAVMEQNLIRSYENAVRNTAGR